MPGVDFHVPGNTLPAFYAYVVGAVFLVSIFVARGDLKAFRALSQRLVLPLAVMGLIVGALWFTRSQPPPLRAVNGTYTSACCASVQLKDGVLISGSFRIPFKLSMEKAGDMDHPNKIGLVGVTPMTVGIRAGQVGAMPDPGEDPAHFIFADDRKSFTLCAARCRTEYQFVRR